MPNQSNLQFLREKIEDLKTALLFSEHSALLRISTTIVEVLKVDEVGQIWFLVPKPPQALHEFDKEFPVKMDFFRKGRRFYLTIAGKAYIINDPEEINAISYDQDTRIPENRILIKVTMSKAEYFESAAAIHLAWWQEILSWLRSWMFNTKRGYRPYYLHEEAGVVQLLSTAI